MSLKGLFEKLNLKPLSGYSGGLPGNPGPGVNPPPNYPGGGGGGKDQQAGASGGVDRG